MPEVYTLRAPENFNYTNARRSTPVRVKNTQNSHHRKPEMHYLKSNDRKKTVSYDLLKATPSPVHGNSSSRSTPVPTNTKRKSPQQPLNRPKPEMYHLDTGGKKTPEYNQRSPSTNSIQHKPKSNGILTHSVSPSEKKVTIYMITSSKEDHFLPHISRTPSPLIRSTQKKPLVTFDTSNHDDKYEILNQQRHSPTEIRYPPLFQSKATESIQRSMDMYRFRRL